MGNVPEHLDELPRDRDIVVMCHHGGRSERVTRFLNANGFPNAKNLAGGIDAYAAQIEPDLARY
jgi:adenylyltransferase/sulfurtransferase